MQPSANDAASMKKVGDKVFNNMEKIVWHPPDPNVLTPVAECCTITILVKGDGSPVVAKLRRRHRGGGGLGTGITNLPMWFVEALLNNWHLVSIHTATPNEE